IDNSCSPIWKALLGMRNKAREHMKYVIGNVKSILVCYDSLHLVGPLCNVITKRDLYDARLPDGCSVDEAIERDSEKDVAKWVDNNRQLVDFSVKNVWKDRDRGGDKVNRKPMTKMIKNCSMNWKGIISEMSQLKSNKNIWCIVRKLVCGAALYYIWNERNARYFGNIKKNEDVLCQEIEDTFRMRLMSLIVKESRAVKNVEIKGKVNCKELV
ncbi:hypothetical protein Tco_1171377, partial [Tanacetum coccineum]